MSGDLLAVFVPLNEELRTFSAVRRADQADGEIAGEQTDDSQKNFLAMWPAQIGNGGQLVGPPLTPRTGSGRGDMGMGPSAPLPVV